MDFAKLLEEMEAELLKEAEKQAYFISEGLPGGSEKACYDLAKSCIIYGARLYSEMLLEKLNNTYGEK